MESGFMWLPAFLWRANKTWRGVRSEVPWVKRPPADIIRDHVRFTVQPIDEPPEHINAVGATRAIHVGCPMCNRSPTNGCWFRLLRPT